MGFSLKASVFALICIALASCATASKEESAEAMGHYRVGATYLREDKLQQAYVEFQKSIILDPSNKEFHNALGIVNLRLKYYTESETAFRKSLKIDMNYSEAHNNLCFLYYEQAMWKEAETECRLALKNTLYNTPEKAFYNLGQVYRRTGKYDEAIGMYYEAVKRSPGLYLAFYGLALTYNAQGNYGRAAEAMTDAIGLDPRYRGDRKKAEADLRSERAEGARIGEIKELIEILHY